MMSLFPVIALIGFVLHLWRDRQPRTSHRTVELLLVYLMVFVVGCGGVFAFMGHAFRADAVARGIGWPTGSPFQFEVAVANLSYGILGLLCIRFRGLFPAAAGIGYCMFLLGAAYVHIHEMVAHRNLSPYNAGPFLYVGDILMPAILLLVILAYGLTLAKKTAGA